MDLSPLDETAGPAALSKATVNGLKFWLTRDINWPPEAPATTKEFNRLLDDCRVVLEAIGSRLNKEWLGVFNRRIGGDRLAWGAARVEWAETVRRLAHDNPGRITATADLVLRLVAEVYAMAWPIDWTFKPCADAIHTRICGDQARCATYVLAVRRETSMAHKSLADAQAEMAWAHAESAIYYAKLYVGCMADLFF